MENKEKDNLIVWKDGTVTYRNDLGKIITRNMTQYEKDLSRPLTINDTVSSKGYYNLVISIRDLKLYKVGLRPHRHWRLKHVKEYFGVKGSVTKMITHLEQLRDS